MKKKTLLILTTTFLAALGAVGLLATFAQGRAAAATSPNSPEEASSEEEASSPEAVDFYDDQRTAARAAAWWLVSAHQNDDGGYAPFSSGANQMTSTVGGTADAMLALGAAGYPLDEPFPGKSQTPLNYLHGGPDDVAAYAASGGGPAGKLIQALVVADQDPYDFAGYNLVVSLTNHLSTAGQFALTPYQHSLAILGLAAVGEPVPVTATQWLTSQQNVAGAWSDGFGTDDNVDATGMAVMALVASDVPTSATSLISATHFLAGAQLSSGGWPYAPGPGAVESTNSTALAVQALSALGEDFYGDGNPWAQDGTPLEALLAWQREGGAFQVDFGGGAFDSFYATVQALPAVTGHPYPLPGRYESARQAIACLDDLQDPATAGWEQFATFGVNAAGTSRAIQAIAAFGEDPGGPRWTMTDTTAVDALENLTPAYLSGGRGGRVGIVMQGVVDAGEPYTVTSFAGYNLPISVTQYLSNGQYADTSFGPVAHDEAMLGLLVAGYQPAPEAVQWLLGAHVDGDWGTPDADGLSLNVLGRLGVAPPAAVPHLRQTQGVDGGWWSFGSINASASSEVVQGLVSAGHNPFDPSWSQVVSGRITNAAHAVMAQQMDGGCWPNFDGSAPDPFATTDAVLLLMARPGWYVDAAHLPAVFNPAGLD